MKVGELIEKLSKYDPELPVLIDSDDLADYIEPANTVDNGDAIIIY
ncbi:MAG: hypothetical protein LBS20_11835 [Prevotella sp.]|jgi:hypothetical protein|nr:hypothetical protein [Prevotella sp.]